ncbi:hypothetical protein [Haloarchaeobius sp. HRN-SO-5]|uniref:hypothetical protein n=1 Tax=Haloarchaeobius sp. HRN-SO-5 TaxID=3446118 RepID=UPI003EBCC38C
MAVQSPPRSPVTTRRVLSRATDALASDPRILLVGIAVVLLGFVPVAASLATPVVGGFALVLTHRAFAGHEATDRSYRSRVVSGVGATVLVVVAVVTLVALVATTSLLAVAVGAVTVVKPTVGGFLAAGVVLLLLAPILYVALRLQLALPAVFIDGERAVDAIAGSWDRTEGNVATVFGVELVVAVLSGVATLALVAAFGSAFPGTSETANTFVNVFGDDRLVTRSTMVVRYTVVGSSTVSTTIPNPDFLLGYSLVLGLFNALGFSARAVMYEAFERVPAH